MSSSQKRISSYFAPTPSHRNGTSQPTQLPSAKALGKRPASVVDLTVDDDTECALKSTQKRVKKEIDFTQNGKSKATVSPLFLPEPFVEPTLSSLPVRTQTNGKVTPLDISRSPPRTQKSTVDKYRFDSSPGKEKPPEPEFTPEQQKKKNARRAAFKKKLLEDNNLFSKPSTSGSSRQSPAPDVEMRDVNNDDETVVEGSDEERPHLPKQIKMKAFMDLVENSKSVKSKGKKAVEEIGPSGQTFTPLENQVNKDSIDIIDKVFIHKCDTDPPSEKEVPRRHPYG